MNKTLVLAFILICACTSIFCSYAQAAEIVDGGTCGENVQWSFNVDGELVIWGVGEIAVELEAANNHNYPWYKHLSSIRSITIQEGITAIGGSAFQGSGLLVTVSLPSTLTKIGYSAFSNCDALQHIAFPNALEEIGNYAFSDSSGLVSLIFPESLKSIGSYAFSSCLRLKSVAFLGELTSIQSCAFKYCPALSSVALPNKLRRLASGVFQDCYSLSHVDLPETLEVIEAASFYASGVKEITIPSNVETIELYALFNCQKVSFLGDAPNVVAYDPIGKQGTFSVSTNIYYSKERNGWTTPKWNKYNCYPIEVDVPTPTPIVNCNHVDDLGYALYGEILNTWREYPYFGTEDSCYVVEYDSYICSGCSEVATWHSDWYDDHVFGANGVCRNCGYTADGVYVGTEATPTPKPTNTPTAIPTPTPMTEPTATPVQSAKTLDDLTDVDYLAFASLAYEDAQQNATVEQMLKNLGKWDKRWEGTDIYYYELYNRIKDWYVYGYSKDTRTGYYATVYASRHSNDAVIAYRGSIPFDVIGSDLASIKDAYNDWILNDVPPIACDAESTKSQFYNAIETYNEILSFRDTDEIAVTGHSLGGGLANTVSAYSGCKGVAFNGVAILDMFYFNHYLEMSENFKGINKWNFVDHVNKFDILAGMWQVGQKNAYIHESMETGKENLLENFVNHSLHPMIFKDDDGVLHLTKYKEQSAYEIARYLGIKDDDQIFPEIAKELIHAMSIKDRMLFLGTARSNYYELKDSWSFGLILPYDIPVVALGGNGNDSLIAGRGEDRLIGGKDDDILDGSWDDDIYVYYKGDGVDIIQDTAGKDTIYLYGFAQKDQIEVISTSEQHIFYEYTYTDDKGIKYNVWGIPGAGDQLTPPITDINLNRIPLLEEHIPAQEYSTVLYGGKEILKIANGRSNNRANKLTIVTEYGEEIDVTPYLDLRWITKRVELNCPIDVEILDASDNVVYTLYDSNPGSFYTAYGNFYVTPLDNSAHCSKVLDLFEGYSVRIKGIGNGTMDISVYDTDGHTLFDPVGAEDVIITPKTVATLEENAETGKLVLVVDNDGDGTADGEVVLRPVHPNNDDHDKQLMKVEAVEPTCVENGHTEYYLCSCGKLFVDKEGTKEITDPSSVILQMTNQHQYKNGVCTVCGQKEVNPNELPQTGDPSRLGLWISFLAISVIMGTVFMCTRRKA